MNADLILLGKRIDMGRQRRRRGVVVAIFLTYFVWIAVCVARAVQSQSAAPLLNGFIWLLLVSFLVNMLILGGKTAGGW